MATLVKVDRNGSKHFEGYIHCDRCGGQGTSDVWKATGWTCYKCGGSGKVFAKWIERTPEYEAKLAENRRKRNEAKLAEQKADMQEMMDAYEKQKREREAEEARIKAAKAQSSYIGEIGDKVDLQATYERSAWFTTQYGYQTQVVYIHTFRDGDGNALTWKTSATALADIEEGTIVRLQGTIKEHKEYKDEKQTALTRCKVTA